MEKKDIFTEILNDLNGISTECICTLRGRHPPTAKETYLKSRENFKNLIADCQSTCSKWCAKINTRIDELAQDKEFMKSFPTGTIPRFETLLEKVTQDITHENAAEILEISYILFPYTCGCLRGFITADIEKVSTAFKNELMGHN